MPLNAKKMAMTGLLLAFNEVLLILSGILEFNTLFLLGGASFLIGIVIREYNISAGAAFYVAAVILGLIIAPNKIYCFTYAAMGLYILAIEIVWKLLQKANPRWQRRVVFWVFKYFIFNIIYIPILFVFPKLLFAGTISKLFIAIAVVAGQVVILLYDKAYDYFQGGMWGKIRVRLGF